MDWTPVLLFQDFERGDVEAMREWWRGEFHFVPYKASSPSMVLRRWARRSPWLSRWVVRLQGRKASGGGATSGPMDLDHWYDPAIESKVGQLLADSSYKAVITEYVVLSRFLENLPRPVLKIIDTVELFAIGRRPEMAVPWSNFSLADEVRGLRRADVVWAIQKEDELALRKELGVGPRVLTVGHRVAVQPLPQESCLGSSEVLLVASNHQFNLQGLRWFAQKVYPLLEASVRPEEIVVVGSAGEALRAELPFRCLGRVPDLTEHYQRARVVVCPVIDGTGLKIKVVEALGFGRPVVTTRAGATGLEAGAGSAFVLADSPQEFAEAVLRVRSDPTLCASLMTAAPQFIEELNSEVQRALTDSLSVVSNVR